MSLRTLIAVLPIALATPALAQPADPHAGHHMPAPAPVPAVPPVADPHAGHAMPTTPQTAKQPAQQTGADLPVGEAAAPQPPAVPLADAIWGKGPMDAARTVLRTEHGGARASQLMLDIAEFDLGSKAYEWEGEAWFGTDEHRLVLKSEGEGARGHSVESAEAQVLYSRPIGLYTDLQAGVRQDLEKGPRRTYTAVGFESLFPYWFEAEGTVFLSHKGELSARLEGSYDFRLAQRLVLQPRGELNLSAEDVPSRGIGAGLSDAELALRLRYEIRREFSPYVGVVWARKFGDTARFARAEGDDVEETRVVAGLRAWF
ncbi:MAG: copper resistance protein B [Pseudomonadota bacterium]